MEKKDVDRINELARKMKTVGLHSLRKMCGSLPDASGSDQT